MHDDLRFLTNFILPLRLHVAGLLDTGHSDYLRDNRLYILPA